MALLHKLEPAVQRYGEKWWSSEQRTLQGRQMAGWLADKVKANFWIAKLGIVDIVIIDNFRAWCFMIGFKQGFLMSNPRLGRFVIAIILGVLF